jgi:hypothetical protein
MEFKKNRVVLDKVINKLDCFVLDFVRELEKHTNYVIVSGYVSILFGRTRVTEDVDLLVPKLDLASFKKLHDNLIANGFWCLNSSGVAELFNDYLSKGVAIRFAYSGKSIPNIEFKFAKNRVDEDALQNSLQVEFKGNGALNVSPIEQQIAYKKIILGSDKDKEDARHLEKLFEGHLDAEKLKYYEALFRRK